MRIEQEEYRGVPCLTISNGIVELRVSLGFGPRILFYGYVGGQNFFHVFDEHLASQDKGAWHNYGGHRLWLAPEDPVRSYYPDNHPIEWKQDHEKLVFTAPVEKATGVQKIIELGLEAKSTRVSLNHRIVNYNAWSIEFSAWALSVMSAGGRALIPHEEYKPHPNCLSPARPLVLWHFTNMADPRFRWGTRYIQMAQDNAHETKLKIGVLNTTGRAAYVLGDEVFVKHHRYIEGAPYPDMGCNAEFFTMPNFLEVETLSPLTRVEPKGQLCHEETWELKKMSLGFEERDIDAVFV